MNLCDVSKEWGKLKKKSSYGFYNKTICQIQFQHNKIRSTLAALKF